MTDYDPQTEYMMEKHYYEEEREQSETITVCSECLTAACWKGVFMCENADIAGTVEKTPEELRALNREHSDWWDGTYERRVRERG